VVEVGECCLLDSAVYFFVSLFDPHYMTVTGWLTRYHKQPCMTE
jgi:hypothetical protein